MAKGGKNGEWLGQPVCVGWFKWQKASMAASS